MFSGRAGPERILPRELAHETGQCKQLADALLLFAIAIAGAIAAPIVAIGIVAGRSSAPSQAAKKATNDANEPVVEFAKKAVAHATTDRPAELVTGELLEAVNQPKPNSVQPSVRASLLPELKTESSATPRPRATVPAPATKESTKPEPEASLTETPDEISKYPPLERGKLHFGEYHVAKIKGFSVYINRTVFDENEKTDLAPFGLPPRRNRSHLRGPRRTN